MNRPRDRKSAEGLLHRMEARPWADGRTVTYRYHPVGKPPINLGTDRVLAIRRVANMNGLGDDVGTINRLWEQYQETPDWEGLGDRTKDDYKKYAAPLLQVFGDTLASEITAPMIARYLRVERKKAPVRANREISLLGNLISLAIERGEAEHNPCRGGQVKRNKERPRTRSPEQVEIDALVQFAATLGGQWAIVMMAAEFAALAGNRKIEFLNLHWSQINDTEIRLMRAKQHGGTERVEKIELSPAMRALLARLRPIARDDRIGAVFPNRYGNTYTHDGFNSMWQKLMLAAHKKEVISKRFTFHDLRAHYVTTHKSVTGELPDMHASPTTTARVYERSKIAKRKSL